MSTVIQFPQFFRFKLMQLLLLSSTLSFFPPSGQRSFKLFLDLDKKKMDAQIYIPCQSETPNYPTGGKPGLYYSKEQLFPS
jgi:hypothetical protein